MASTGIPSHRSMVIKVSAFAVTMLLVAAALVVVSVTSVSAPKVLTTQPSPT